MAYTYYITQRPYDIGCQPQEGLIAVESFDLKTYIDAIGRAAWSRLTYDRELTDDEIETYELTRA